MKNKIVTGFYTDQSCHGFPFFGHPDKAREDRYFHSLRVLNNMDTEIVCYCNEIQFNQILDYIKQFELNNVKLKVSNLSDSKYSARIKSLKEKTKDFNFYHEIDWNKIFLLEKEFDSSYNYIFWFDVGLSHHGLFPKRFNPNGDKITGMSYDYNTYSFTNIFNKGLIDGITSFLQDNLISINNDRPFHSIQKTNEIYEDDIIFNGITVGGILGGHVSKLQWFISNFYKLAEISLSKNYILNHEAIIGYMKEKFPNNFKNFNFQTWYHEDFPGLGDQIKNITHFAHFFDFIFDNFVNMKKNSLK